MRNAAGAVLVGIDPGVTAVAMLLSQWMLRPIHVDPERSIAAGTRRAGTSRLDLGRNTEFRDLGSSFEAVSAQLSGARRRRRHPGRARPTSNRWWTTSRTRSRCSGPAAS